MKKMMEFPFKTLIQGKNRRTILSIAVAMTLSGCAVGPDFKVPESPVKPNADTSEPYSYTATPVATHTEESEGNAGVAQKLIAAKDIPAQWWEVFHSEELDALIRSALDQSPDLASAQAALRQAQENYNAQYGDTIYPSVSANLGVERDLASQATQNPADGRLYSLYNASVSVSYTFDLFGANKRALESTQAAVDFQRFQVEATYLTLTANLVTTAIKEASIRAQINATEEILLFQSQQLEVIERQYAIGAIPKVSVLEQRSLVAQTRASLPGLKKLLRQTRNQLAVYSGRLPSDANLPEFDLNSLQLPEELPVSIPSALVRQRPDIRANEALLHQASALVGVATANQYPQITLSANYGSSALSAGTLFQGSSEVWRLAGGLTQPIFNGGALSAKRRAAVAAFDQANAQYRATVLAAFQSVANSLEALEFDANTLKQQVEVENVAKQTLDLATQQFNLGAVSSLTLLDAKRTYQTERLNLVLAQAARYADTAALFQSLGGGWWNRAELKDISIKNE